MKIAEIVRNGHAEPGLDQGGARGLRRRPQGLVRTIIYYPLTWTALRRAAARYQGPAERRAVRGPHTG